LKNLRVKANPDYRDRKETVYFPVWAKGMSATTTSISPRSGMQGADCFTSDEFDVCRITGGKHFGKIALVM
jgi:hypothetical protein